MVNWLKRSVGILAVAGALLCSAGCGGSGDDGGSAAPPTAKPGAAGVTASEQPSASPGITAEDAKKKLGDCLSKEGINKIPTGSENLPAKEQLAVQKCGMALLNSADPGLQSRIDALNACLKKQSMKVCQTQTPTG